MVTAGLLDQLREEYGESWYACVMFAEGHCSMRGATDTTPEPAWQTRDAMFRCSVKLNRDLHHGGCWTVVWHLDRMSFMWRDEDGDAAFIQQFDEPWIRIKGWSTEEFCQRADAAWEAWRELLTKVFERKPEETIRRALGEKPKAPPSLH